MLDETGSSRRNPGHPHEADNPPDNLHYYRRTPHYPHLGFLQPIHPNSLKVYQTRSSSDYLTFTIRG